MMFQTPVQIVHLSMNKPLEKYQAKPSNKHQNVIRKDVVGARKYAKLLLDRPASYALGKNLSVTTAMCPLTRWMRTIQTSRCVKLPATTIFTNKRNLNT